MNSRTDSYGIRLRLPANKCDSTSEKEPTFEIAVAIILASASTISQGIRNTIITPAIPKKHRQFCSALLNHFCKAQFIHTSLL